jgi:hypothetical protein
MLSQTKCSDYPAFLRIGNARTYEQPRDNYSEDKAANVRQVGHTSRLRLRHFAGIHQLREKPEAD